MKKKTISIVILIILSLALLISGIFISTSHNSKAIKKDATSTSKEPKEKKEEKPKEQIYADLQYECTILEEATPEGNLSCSITNNTSNTYHMKTATLILIDKNSKELYTKTIDINKDFVKDMNETYYFQVEEDILSKTFIKFTYDYEKTS